MISLKVCLITLLVVALKACADEVTSVSIDPFTGAEERDAQPFRPGSIIVSKRVYIRDGIKLGERSFYAGRVVATEVPLKDGTPHGMTRLFYPSGKLFSQQPYTDGKLDGLVRFFKEDGELLGESKLVAGTGMLRRFKLLGVSNAKEEVYFKDGLAEGLKFGWLSMGELGEMFEITECVRGISHGRSVVFDAQGRLVSSAMMKPGGLHGVWRQFGSEGKPEPGYPKYYIADRKIGDPEVSREEYLEAAKTDPVLAQSLVDDNEKWGREIIAKRLTTVTDPVWLPPTTSRSTAPTTTPASDTLKP